MASGDNVVRRRVALPKYMRRRTPGDIVFDVLNTLLLVAFCLTIVYPFWMTLLLSFSSTDEATSLGFHLWIRNWQITAYRFALSRYGNVPTAYVNSIFRTIMGTVLTVMVTLLAGYPLSKRNLPYRNVVTVVILVTMFFSGGLIPTYLLIRNIGLYDSRWALILPTLAQGYYIIIMRNFLMTVDKAYEESAFMDGANYAQILVRIVVPLSKPVIATIALWTAVYHWNEWFSGIIYVADAANNAIRKVTAKIQRELPEESK